MAKYNNRSDRLIKWMGALFILLLAGLITQEIYLSQTRPEQPNNAGGFSIPERINHGHLVYLSNCDATIRSAFMWGLGITFFSIVFIKIITIRKKDSGNQ